MKINGWQYTAAICLVLLATTPALTQITVIGGTTGVPKDTVGYQKWMLFRDRLGSLSDGEMEVTPMVTGELGSEEVILNGLRRGRIHIINISGLVAGTLVPEIALLQAPFLFDSEAEADYVYDHVLFDIYHDLLAEHGLKFLSWDEVGVHHVYGKSPLIKPNDLKNKRFRVPSGLAARLFAEALGADIIPLSFSENIIGLQTGLVDAGANAVILYASTGIAEEAPHITLTGHITAVNFVLTADRWLNSLSPKHQHAVDTSWLPINQAREMSRREAQDFLGEAVTRGFNIHTLTARQREVWRQASAPVTQQLIDSIGGRAAAIYQAIRGGKSEFQRAHSIE